MASRGELSLSGNSFIPYASTLASLSLDNQREERERERKRVTLKDLKELQEKNMVVIERCLEQGEEERIPLLFSFHERIEELIRTVEREALGEIDFERENDFLRRDNNSQDLDNFLLLDEESDYKMEEEEDTETSFECLICYDSFSYEETYKLRCGHRYCFECLVTYLKGLIEVAEVELPCPDPSCHTKTIARDDIKALVGEEGLQKHDRFAALALLRKDQSTRWCPNCEAPVSGEPPPGQSKIVCFDCKTAFCYNCKDRWHEGKTCAEYRSSNPTDRKTQRWMKREGVQNCPHCGLSTIRATGCRDMKCVNCGQHWKWEGDANETQIEKVAYFYPRSVKYIATSREAHENDQGIADEIKTNLFVGTFAAFVLSPALVVTIPLIIPALAVTMGRKTKSGFFSLVDRYYESWEEGEEGEGGGGGEEGKGKERAE